MGTGPIIDINIPNGGQAPLTRPPVSPTRPPVSPTRPPVPPTRPTVPPIRPPATTSSPDEIKYQLSPESIYKCEEPGFFEDPSSCNDFYMCKEVRPGVLSADRVFRCPDRYLFDPVTSLCQRAEKVVCNHFKINIYRSTLVNKL